MRKIFATAGLCTLFAACSPSGSSDNSTSVVGGVPPLHEMTALEQAGAFFENGPGQVDPGGEVDTGIEENLTGGTSYNLALGVQVRLLPVPGFPGTYNVTIRNTGSGYKELFVLQIPANPPPGPRPMLVAFHRYGVSHADALLWTSFPAECQARGWYFVAPLSGSQNHFSSQVALINTRRVLDVMQQIYSIDSARVYGVGFSMGGGAALNYAARSLDPAALRFAAVVNHTGTVSTGHAYDLEVDDNDADDGPIPGGANLEPRDWLEFWHGGTPQSKSFAYQQSSLMVLSSINGQVEAGTDLMRNLAHLKLQTWLANGDNHPYLVQQSLAFDAQAATLGLDHSLQSVNFTGHSWDTLDEAAICNWFSGITYTEPSSGNLLADGDGQKLFHFRAWQDQNTALTPFQWLVDVGMNRVNLWGTTNLKRLEFDATDLGLAYSGSLRINHSNVDSTSDELLLLNVPAAPLQLLRNGVAASGTYDAQASTYLITTTAGSAAQWVVQF